MLCHQMKKVFLVHFEREKTFLYCSICRTVDGLYIHAVGNGLPLSPKIDLVNKKQDQQLINNCRSDRQNNKVSPGDNCNISCRHHGEQATACTIMQPTTIYHYPQDVLEVNLFYL